MDPIVKAVYIDALGRLDTDKLDSKMYYDFINTYRAVPTLEEQIARMMSGFPGLFPERKYALEHLYCVIGNGYTWIRGGLVSAFPEESPREREARIAQDKMIKELRIYTNSLFAKANELLGVKEEAPIREEKKRKFKIYEIHGEYSKLCTIPDDVRPDYLQGALEMISIIEQEGADNTNNLNIALKTKRDIQERFYG